MATRAELEAALINADKAGDTAAARTLANAIIDMQSGGAPEPRGLLEETGRQVGLTARAGLKGLVALPGMVADAASGIVNTGLDVYDNMRSPTMSELVTGKQKGFRFQTTRNALDNLLTGAGVAQPENATERVVQDITEAGAGTGASVGVGNFLSRSAKPIVSKVGQIFSTGPGMQTAAAATSAGASGVTRESGGGTGAQVLAGLGGAVAPSAIVGAGSAAVRGMLRGGEQGRQTVNNNIKLFNDAGGMSPSVGQATERRFPRAIESVLSKSPGSAGVMQRKAQQSADDMAQSLRQTADELAPGGNAVNAGEAIEKGVNGFKEGFKKVQERLYNTLDKHIPNETPIPVGNTEFALKQLNEGIEGAPNISEFFKNSKIKGIDKALQADLELSASGGALPYEAVKKLRTLIGREIADNSLLSDVPRSKWTALYAALSEDLGMAAKQAGPDAQQSWQWANKFTSGQLERLESLSKVVGKDSPEKVFNAALAGSADGNTIIKRVVDAIPKANRKELASAVMRRMGQANNSAQNAEQTAFSAETFLTNYSKLSPQARETLFGRLGMADVPAKLDKLAQVASNMRDGSKVFANPSGTAQVLSTQNALVGILGAALTGNYMVAVGGAGLVGGANLLSKKMTDPAFVRWLGQQTTVSPSLPAATTNAMMRMATEQQP
jgi:hypothetical protein